MGSIGSLVANMALELGMRVAGYDPAISVESAWRLSSRVEKMDSLEALLAISDFISLHVPAIEQTRHLIGEAALKRLKPGARLLNFAREEIVDAEALRAALDSGRLAGYVTDFPVPGLLGRDNVLLLPHIGASTREAEENCSVMAAEQLMDFLENGNIRTFEIAPEQAGLKRASGDALKGGDAAENATALRAVLEGKPSAFRDCALLNAAAALIVAGRAGDLPEGVSIAQKSIDSGAALHRLTRLIAISNG